jgi:hypothetical protein
MSLILLRFSQGISPDLALLLGSWMQKICFLARELGKDRLEGDYVTGT